MGGSNPDAVLQRLVIPRAALVGVALGMVTAAGASLVLYAQDDLLAGSAGLIGTALVSLWLGIWAGAPAALAEEPPIRQRWAAAGLSVAVAGAFATFWALYGELQNTSLARISGLLVLIAAPAYALGLVLPVLLAWAERLQDPSDDEAEGWGPLGGLVLGALGGAAAGVLIAGLLLVPWLGVGPLLLGLSVALVVPMALDDPERPEPEERLLHAVDTPFGSLRVTEVLFPRDRQPERRLYLNDEQESAELVRSGAPTLAYIAAAESWLAATTSPGRSYLFLGGGAYTLPRRVAERDPRAQIVVVELDPEVTRIAYRFFGMRPELGIRSVHGDARAFVERADEAVFDRIYLDVYGGQESLPFSLVTVEAFTSLRRRLRPDGVLAMNLIGAVQGPEADRLWSVLRTAGEVFPALALYTHLGPDFPERQNFLLAASPDPEHAFNERAGLFERWPASEWPQRTGATVFYDLQPVPVPEAARPRRQGVGSGEQGP